MDASSGVRPAEPRYRLLGQTLPASRNGPVRRRRIVPEPRRFLLYRGDALVAEGVEWSGGGVCAWNMITGQMLAFESMLAFMSIQRRRGIDPTLRFLDERRTEPASENEVAS